MTTATSPGIADVLAGDDLDLRPFNGFGGLQGGIVAAITLREIRAVAGAGLVPVELTAHVVRPVDARLRVSAEVTHRGRAVTVVSATASAGARTAAVATAVLGSEHRPGVPTTRVRLPEVDHPLAQARRFVVPPEFVPISTRIEIRPATDPLPFSASPEPNLRAWIRLAEEVADPWERLLVLADALAPSLSAVMTELRTMPTVRTTVRFTPEVATEDFSWVLVDAVTVDASDDGWLTENITIWTPDGTPLATSSQLRAVR
ncbi:MULTISPECIES: acyl-CoA thioesterase [unclassified Aeromicrobium]|uniref:acyl-CoA thioesterase n=1 Tax=unclassified Aeromicrobium TaxID=2633570 RepID=UPI00396B2F43